MPKSASKLKLSNCNISCQVDECQLGNYTKNMKVYTKTGDKGTTGLVGGTRVPKSHVRLEAYGTIDELNAHLGVLIAEIAKESESASSDIETIRWIQNKLFVIGTLLATESDSPLAGSLPRISEEEIHRIEQKIDVLQIQLPPLQAFILPGGIPAAASAHVCRTVCRRAERRLFSLVDAGFEIDSNSTAFLNRLSDYLFVLSRSLNQRAGNDDFLWDKSL